MPLFDRVLCGECGAEMQLVDAVPGDRYQEGRAFWRCSRAPTCLGTHGAHPDGRPLGIPADRKTNMARLDAHAVFDRLWRERFVPSRDAAYAWLQSVMRLSEDAAHFAKFDIATCEKARRFAEEFIQRWRTTESPLVNRFADPWGLVPPGVDPDDLGIEAPAEPDTPAPSLSATTTDIFCEQPEGW